MAHVTHGIAIFADWPACSSMGSLARDRFPGADRGHGVVPFRPADLGHCGVSRSLGLVVGQLSLATLR